VRQLLAGMAGREGSERYTKAQAIERDLLVMLREHRQDVLRFGSVGRLLVAKEIEAVLPLDAAELLDAARPITAEGEVKADPAKIKARQDAQVKAALKSGRVALIVLGGSHDLSASVRELAPGACEYVRVTTREYREVAGEK
jgi:hypothetical protein